MTKTGRATVKSIASYALAGGIKGLCLWFIFILFARNTSTEIAGQFALAIAIVSPTFALLSLNLRVVVATDQQDDYHFFEYQKLRLICSVAAALLSLVLGLLLGFGTGVLLAILVSLIVARLFETNSDIRFGIMQKNNRLDLAALSMILSSVGSALSVLIVFWLTASITTAILVYPIGYIIVFYIVDRPNSRRFLTDDPNEFRIGNLSWNRLGAIALLSAPLGVVFFLLMYRANVPKYALTWFLTKSDVAIFTALVCFVPLFVLPITAANQTLSPRLAKLFAQGKIKKFVRLHSMLFLIAATVSASAILFAVFFGGPVLRYLYGEQYVLPTELLILLAGQSLCFFSGCVGTGLSAMRKFSMQGMLAIVSAIVVTVAAIPLVYYHGLVGACWLPAVDGLTRLVLTSTAYIVLLRQQWTPRHRTPDDQNFAYLATAAKDPR